PDNHVPPRRLGSLDGTLQPAVKLMKPGIGVRRGCHYDVLPMLLPGERALSQPFPPDRRRGRVDRRHLIAVQLPSVIAKPRRRQPRRTAARDIATVPIDEPPAG